MKSDGRRRVTRSFNRSVDKKHLEDENEEAEILKMYNPGHKMHSARPQLDLEAIPSIEGKTRVKNANVYL